MSQDRLRTPETSPNFAVEKILVAGNRGPCGGVNMALVMADHALEIVDGREPIYSLWDVVHNKPVTAELKQRGLISVNFRYELIPDYSIVFIPAHGSYPKIYEMAKMRHWELIDVTCQLVSNVKIRTKKAEDEGYHNIYIGKAGHPETMAVLGGLRDDRKSLVESVEDVEALELPAVRKIVHSQTTLSPRTVQEIENALKRKYDGRVHDPLKNEVLPKIEIPDRLGICYATTNRQAAVVDLVNKIDMLVVVGSEHSHNSQELRVTGEINGRPSYLVDDSAKMREDWFRPHITRVGVTSGASVLDRFMEPVIDWIKERSPQAEVIYEPQAIAERDLTFVLPQKAIDALRARYNS